VRLRNDHASFTTTFGGALPRLEGHAARARFDEGGTHDRHRRRPRPHHHRRARVVEDAAVTGTGAHEISAAEIVADPQWAALKTAAEAIRPHQVKDGSIPEQMRTPRPRATWV